LDRLVIVVKGALIDPYLDCLDRLAGIERQGPVLEEIVSPALCRAPRDRVVYRDLLAAHRAQADIQLRGARSRFPARTPERKGNGRGRVRVLDGQRVDRVLT